MKWDFLENSILEPQADLKLIVHCKYVNNILVLLKKLNQVLNQNILSNLPSFKFYVQIRVNRKVE